MEVLLRPGVLRVELQDLFVEPTGLLQAPLVLVPSAQREIAPGVTGLHPAQEPKQTETGITIVKVISCTPKTDVEISLFNVATR